MQPVADKQLEHVQLKKIEGDPNNAKIDHFGCRDVGVCSFAGIGSGHG
jgi:hypothetical protein